MFTEQKIEDTIPCDMSVQDGTTERIVWLFEKVDDALISVELSDGQKFIIE